MEGFSQLGRSTILVCSIQLCPSFKCRLVPHTQGVMYLSIFNLPRMERFKQHNVLLVGIIPGPKEPELHLNSFLQPLVDELKMLWKGVQMVTPNGITTIVRAALLGVTSLLLGKFRGLLVTEQL